MKLRIFLSGGSGFIGKNIKEQLSNKYTIVCPTHTTLNILNREDVNRFFKKNGYFNVVIHAANFGGTRKIKDNPKITENNLKMFLNIIENKKNYGKLINFGSGAEYDKRFPIKKVKEEALGKSIPVDGYGLSKYLCCLTNELFLENITLRLFGVFGKHEDWGIRFISNAICKTLFNLPITINQNVVFNYLYVNDLVRIIDCFIQKNTWAYKTYNVGSNRTNDLKEIAKKIANISKSHPKIFIKNKGLGKEYSCDNSRLMAELKGLEFTNLDQSIIELFDWYRKNMKYINEDKLKNDVFD